MQQRVPRIHKSGFFERALVWAGGCEAWLRDVKIDHHDVSRAALPDVDLMKSKIREALLFLRVDPVWQFLIGRLTRENVMGTSLGCSKDGGVSLKVYQGSQITDLYRLLAVSRRC